jgi:hypothetical protein
MTGNERFEDSIGRWLEETAPNRLPQRVLAATFERTRRTRQDPAWRGVLRTPQIPRFIPALGGAAVLVMATVLVLNVIPLFGPAASPRSSLTPGGSPTAAASPSPDRLSQCTDSFRPGVGTAAVLGCSRDGTRLLIQKDLENLFVLHADGAETQVTNQLTGITRFPGSSRPSGATISPDGSRVVYAGLTTLEGLSCHHGALFAVDADGGPAELLWESRAADKGGIVREPTFSPDGTQIAFADGYCDHNHSVWVMNADGSDAHQIVSNETTLGATHVHGLAWSAAGDRIALLIDQGTYTFATDGSDFKFANPSEFCWPGVGGLEFARQC